MSTKDYFEQLESFLSKLNDYMHDTKNCIEKINIITKINELVFWLQMYQDNYLDEQKKQVLRLAKKDYFFFGALCDKAEPAAVFEALDVRPSLKTLEAALAALALVFL